MNNQPISHVVVIASILLVAVPAYAHPGRTDSSGGHTNRRTGSYHKHNSGGSTYSPSRTAYRSTPRTTYRTSARIQSRISPSNLLPKNNLKKKQLRKQSSSRPKIEFKVLTSTPEYIVLAPKSGSRTLFRVKLTIEKKKLPTKNDLQRIATAIDFGGNFMVYFYLPGMDISKLPWAKASKKSKQSFYVRVYFQRTPVKFNNLK